MTAHHLPPHIRGLLYKEWLAHRNLVVGAWAVWLVCMPVLMIFNHPAWILGFGIVYAAWSASAFGGMDAEEGSEEFTFSLPPTRSEIYTTRLALAGGNLLALLVASWLCLKFNLPQKVWGVFVETGLTYPFSPAGRVWYYFAFSVPAALFATTFVFAALAASRDKAKSAWWRGVLLTGLMAVGGLIAEKIFLCKKASGVMTGREFMTSLAWWQEVTGVIACPALLVLATLAMVFSAYYVITYKEGSNRPTPIRGVLRWGYWLLVGFQIVLFLLVFAYAMTIVTREIKP